MIAIFLGVPVVSAVLATIYGVGWLSNRFFIRDDPSFGMLAAQGLFFSCAMATFLVCAFLFGSITMRFFQ